MIDMSKVDEKMRTLTMPVFFKQARDLGLDMRGEANKKNVLQAILEKVSEMKPKEALAKLDPVFKEMAEASGALNRTNDSGASETAPQEEKSTVQTTKETTKAAKAPPPAKKANGGSHPVKGAKAGKAANTSVPAKKAEPTVAAIVFPKEQLDKIVNASFETAETEKKTVAKAAFQFYGKHYAQVQDVFEDLYKKESEAKKEGMLIPKRPTFDEYMTEVGFSEKLDRSPQRLRKDAIIYKACAGTDGKIPQDVVDRLIVVGTSRAEEVSPLPKPKDAIMKGIVFEGKNTPLEKLTKLQVIAAVQALTGRDSTKPPKSPSSKKLADVPKLFDPVRAALGRLKSVKPNLALAKDEKFKERLQATYEGATKFVDWLKETMDTLYKGK